MNVNKLVDFLNDNPDKMIQIMLPTGDLIEECFHVTEIGRIDKNFIDCGGTIRSSSVCVFQLWIADDVDHRLKTTKLSKIIEMSMPILISDELSIEFEFESEYTNSICHYLLDNVGLNKDKIVLFLTPKRTGCLAPDKCGVSGCC